jgi:tyrosyl-tRNA synthetase
MDPDERLARIVRHTEEVVTEEEVRSLLATTEHPRAYIGFEPSGSLTVAHLITTRKVLDLAEAGCDVTVFLADWHAWINGKLDGNLDRIAAAGKYMQATFRALGAEGGPIRYRWSHELTASSDYWARVVRVAKATSLARTKRAMSIMGRAEEESSLDTSWLYYPAMQVADIFELPVEIAYGGMDQRRGHVLAREAAHHYHWPVPTAIHTPLLSSLKGGGRMNPTDGTIERKMSKSDPSTGILIPSEKEVIAERIQAAFCPAKEVDGNPIVEIVRYIVLPWEGRLRVERPAKYGGPVEFASEKEFVASWAAGQLHPQDLKGAVGEALDRLIEPARRYFASHPDLSPASFAGAPPAAR